MPPTVKQGRHGLLIDTGAVYNLNGDFWRHRYQSYLNQYALKPQAERNTAAFSGIGGKTTVSTKMQHFPVCIDGMCGRFSSQEMEDSKTPAILGLKGIEHQQIMIVPHDEVVIIPNGGKVRISMSKEVRMVKCIRTDSGHLLLLCDGYDNEDTSQSKSLSLFQSKDISGSSTDPRQ